MTGIEFIDTIVVRRSADKGTRMIEESIVPSNWAGKGFKNYEEKRLGPYPNLAILSGKGTSSLKIHSLKKTKLPDLAGRCLVTGRGTGFRISS